MVIQSSRVGSPGKFHDGQGHDGYEKYVDFTLTFVKNCIKKSY